MTELAHNEAPPGHFGHVPLTPIEHHGEHYIKRDDRYVAYGESGGKARTCRHILETHLERGGKPLAITAGSRHSPQVAIVANIAVGLGMRCRFHTPAGDTTPEIERALAAGADHIQHMPGYNTVIVARARQDADDHDAAHVPFGMECWEAVHATASQVRHLPEGVRRIVVPVGSGMSAAGIVHGLRNEHPRYTALRVIGVQVGADPTKRLDYYAPMWQLHLDVVPSGLPYEANVTDATLDGIPLDPVYEAKCLPHLEPGDLFWVVGIRRSAA